jgi:predicted TIM-barrel fold metal-dependent hydrolase
MSSSRIISSDNHVIEPADLWTSRGESKFLDVAPRVERFEDGDWWVCDGRKVIDVSSGGAAVGARFDAPETQTMNARIEDVRPGGYIPEEHVKDMDSDGVDTSIIYPTTGLVLYGVPATELVDSFMRTYNDWVGEFCGAVPKRLKGIAVLNVDNVQTAVGELERCAKMGFAGVMIPTSPPAGRSYDRPEYEPLWAAAQAHEMPISLHVGCERMTEGAGVMDVRGANFIVNVDHFVRTSIGNIIYSGVFERYPKLYVGSVEHEISWALHFLNRLDFCYTQLTTELRGEYRFKGDALPSDFFRSNVFLGFQEDAAGIDNRHRIGIDTIMWGADYPHLEGTFPRSQEILSEILVDCSEEEKAKITGGNAARVYNLN